MAEGSYEYECMRAELLGIEKPDYEEFLKNHPQPSEASEDLDTENVKEADVQGEQMAHIGGGLDELNSILQVTQRKISKFKAGCGSLTNLLKIKMGRGSSSDSLDPDNNPPSGAVAEPPPPPPPTQSGATHTSDLARALDNHVDRLDAMIDKAENAQYSMNYQRNEMRKFLN